MNTTYPLSTGFLRIGFVLLLGLMLTACATTPTGRKQLMLVSEGQAIEASKKAYVEMIEPLEKEGKIDSNKALTQRVNDITDKLIVQAVNMRPETKDWDWQVKVIDDPEMVNAWCMAGGKMAVYTGLIEKVKPTDDELAQVMGHEISHALANHSAEQMSVAMASSLGLMVFGMASDSPAATMTAAAVAAKLAIELPYSRAGESEADRIGIELAAKAGYDPHAAVTLWQKMEKVGGSTPPVFLSTHPSPENRQEKLNSYIPQMMPYYEAAKTQQEMRK
jgi:predicted Zn-dependent protease